MKIWRGETIAQMDVGKVLENELPNKIITWENGRKKKRSR